MKITGPEGSIQPQKGKHGLSYHPEFKVWLKEHPHAMSQVAGLIEKIIDHNPQNAGYELSEGNVRVVFIRATFSHLFKVIIGENIFFVKRDKARLQMPGVFPVGGQGEYTDSAIAKEGLKNDPDIEIIDFQLGYTREDAKHPVAYFVSRWEELQTVTGYLSNPNIKPEEKKEIEAKVTKAFRLFQTYHDVSTKNMFYDPRTKKIKMFDLNENPNF
ncbi:hypothetical protein A2911_02400 [Candidatus Nomurabacteria bacterium RIFCSPLOWO2_01_FULL_40_15]|uniref:Uncharacterized protein n=1 Tax=Candidatus Nomurabacteria bacterium RIFCSPLOWO2_01_FULL_40_15 TaxID=1801772 RepID=A0A1F6X7S8_9BACT|nr:MAG: hypothetical protein A2911_02400 [Candidatus Nomurabacteria bacterium RIFCSPLOWO2_01_FULL_40_15]